MNRVIDFLPSNKRATCWGAGFVAMDVVDVEGDAFVAVGGSCGNVMAILAWLGWTTKPVARLGADATGGFIREELRGLGVDVSYLTEEKRVRSPIVLQRFVMARDGTRTHRFSLTCPECGRWLPRHRPITLAQARPLICGDEVPDVFYFDRVSPASLQLAETARNRDALVVFEPLSVEDESKFQRAVDTCHVLKYSHERLGYLPDLSFAVSPALIVETCGKTGLRYRWGSRWSQLDAFTLEDIVDAAGSGDWCTAMLIHHLGRAGAEFFVNSPKEAVEAALRDGQAAAAINCGFRGARGAMQVLALSELNERLLALDQNTPCSHPAEHAYGSKLRGPLMQYCDQCDTEVRGSAWAFKKAG